MAEEPRDARRVWPDRFNLGCYTSQGLTPISSLSGASGLTKARGTRGARLCFAGAFFISAPNLTPYRGIGRLSGIDNYGHPAAVRLGTICVTAPDARPGGFHPRPRQARLCLGDRPRPYPGT